MASESKSYNISVKEAHDILLEVLRHCGFQINESTENSVKAITEPSLWSWGEEIEVRLSSKPGGVNIQISSSPRSQLFDWGKSEDNVHLIFSKIEELISSRKSG